MFINTDRNIRAVKVRVKVNFVNCNVYVMFKCVYKSVYLYLHVPIHYNKDNHLNYSFSISCVTMYVCQSVYVPTHTHTQYTLVHHIHSYADMLHALLIDG
jgi:hypothetical protein